MTYIDLYTVNLAFAPAELDDLYELLSPEERLRASRYRASRDRDRYIACRGTLRRILAEYLHEVPASIAFSHNRYGKPAVPGYGITFNVSHSGGLALIAVTEGREVGVDVERVDPRFAGEQIPERFFSAAEVAELRALPARQQTRAFFNCWTRKEAYIKARGLGLSMALDSFDVSLAPGAPAALLRGGAGWSLAEIDMGSEYIAAVAAEGQDWAVRRMKARSGPSRKLPHEASRQLPKALSNG